MKCQWFSFFLIAVLLCGCATTNPKDYVHGSDIGIQGVNKKNIESRKTIAISNQKLLKKYYSDFREPNKEEHVCLALSGGGGRSAAFSLGVMKALSDENKLNSISYISSASGGSYANYYYQINRLSDVSEETIFDPNSTFMKRASTRPLVNPLWAAWSGATNILCQLWWLPWRSSSAFKGEPRYECGQSNYYISINSQFGSKVDYLKKRKDDYSFTKYSEIGQNLKETRGPYPIINASVLTGPNRMCRKNIADSKHEWCDTIDEYCDFKKGTFEFSPHRAGSEWIGFNDELDLSLIETVGYSGAALDKADGAFCKLRNIMGFNLGADIREYKSTIDGRKNVKDIYISDAGFVDNLSIYPLVNRKCDKIIIADGVHDPALIHDEYLKAKNIFKHYHNIQFDMPSIDEERERNMNDCGSYKSGPPCFKARDAKTVVHRGTIGPIPYMNDSNTIVDHTIDVTLIKLAIKDEFEPAGKTGAIYLENALLEAPQCSSSTNCGFPQIATVKQNFSDKQFFSYLFLGFNNTQEILE